MLWVILAGSMTSSATWCLRLKANAISLCSTAAPAGFWSILMRSSSTILLALDTSTRTVGWALYDGAQCWPRRSGEPGLSLRLSWLRPVADALQRAGITVEGLGALAVALGPVRSLACGLGWLWQKGWPWRGLTDRRCAHTGCSGWLHRCSICQCGRLTRRARRLAVAGIKSRKARGDCQEIRSAHAARPG